jgi:hypothetical protein
LNVGGNSEKQRITEFSLKRFGRILNKQIFTSKISTRLGRLKAGLDMHKLSIKTNVMALLEKKIKI